MSPRTLLSSTALALFVLFPFTTAHNEQQPLSEDWATKHMQSEHHITSFEPNAFFAMHDFDADGYWEAPEIRRTYGLAPGSTNGVGGPGAEGNPNEEKKQEVESKVLNDFDIDGDGKVSRQEWGTAWGNGKRLKDFGLGPGHHQDDEVEYELHHYEQFHNEHTKEEDLTHAEDIAHFKKHDELDAAADRQADQDKLAIVETNIPPKFRRM